MYRLRQVNLDVTWFNGFEHGLDVALPDAESALAGKAAMARRMPSAMFVWLRSGTDLNSSSISLLRAAFYEGLSHREIAEKTGVPLGTVKSRIRLAFQRMRGRLDGAV